MQSTHSSVQWTEYLDCSAILFNKFHAVVDATSEHRGEIAWHVYIKYIIERE